MNIKGLAVARVRTLIFMIAVRTLRRVAIATLALGVAMVAVASAERKASFGPGPSLPPSWKTGVTGQGAARWDVLAERTAPSASPVLRQSGEATFCWAVKADEKIRDGFVEVKLKPVTGKEDQSGGLIWRFRDGNNYYVVRANALEDNVVLYKTVNGKRSSLQVKGRMFGYGVDINVPQGKWSTLRIEFAGKLFKVFYEGQKLFEVEDDTFPDGGAVGVWTKSDSVTLFDDFTFGT